METQAREQAAQEAVRKTLSAEMAELDRYQAKIADLRRYLQQTLQEFSKAADRMEQKAAAPVSYTHLDVYKRQAYYHLGIYIDLHPDQEVTTFMKTDADTIYMERDGQYEPFEIRGVNLGVGIPGEWATDYAIDKQTYLRWFGWIQDVYKRQVKARVLQPDGTYCKKPPVPDPLCAQVLLMQQALSLIHI